MHVNFIREPPQNGLLISLHLTIFLCVLTVVKNVIPINVEEEITIIISLEMFICH